ncbi:MAG: type III-B CRISPR module RAMP protein Cmr1, partial [Fimbriimonadaceae bacterium]
VAWVLFGGVGARTRRGCGALQAKGWDRLPKDSNEVKAWVRGYQDLPKRDWPTLALAVLGSPSRDAMTAWETLGRFWSAFRKGHIFGDAYSPMSGGKWRDHAKLLGLRPYDQKIDLVKPYLGLPIIYQKFPKSERQVFSGTLEPADSGRFASPVILKPIALGEQVFPAVLALKGPAPSQIRVGDRNQAIDLNLPRDEPLLRNTPVQTVILEADRFFKSLSSGGTR